MAFPKYLQSIRDSYERAFSSHLKSLGDIEEILSDKELGLSGHVFIANKDDRRMQITVDEDSCSSAFIKRMGMDDETILLQIIVSPDDLKVASCEALFKLWMVENIPEDKLSPHLQEFGS